MLFSNVCSEEGEDDAASYPSSPLDRSRVRELHYITPISNLPSIGRLGILSHEAADRLQAASIAMPEIQDIRATKRVPNGLRLHQYANLYFDARNPMMSARRG